MFGHVRSLHDKDPILMIKVSVYRGDLTAIDHVFTNDEGRYDVEIPAGATVTVRFDTHHSLNNAEDWQPSVVANVVASDDTPLDRYLVRRGHDSDAVSAMDALSGYLIAAASSDVEGDAQYADTAVKRLAMLKQHTRVLQDLQQKLLDHFAEQA
ncbi:carboxypeptidase regulatory-like domain-containing protein [Streptomyces sp. NBC_00190]|uniref:carboxypeptidase regulatory-like domain-containing protein n=1 Tax=unclassified Streptomyces TaxID=2593676 RepID=UPI002E28201B|nr:carboxypeptidase regulatory-like domain-containing protein [Streptomyces sp. NBC_00190]WSZ44253.1 carboxypeptidase regulatory-like domain-containing protein [Streptomyces sp. NBC_00868]